MLQLKYHQLGNPQTEATERASPHYCYSPKHDFLIVSVFHYGMDEDEYWCVSYSSECAHAIS